MKTNELPPTIHQHMEITSMHWRFSWKRKTHEEKCVLTSILSILVERPLQMQTLFILVSPLQTSLCK